MKEFRYIMAKWRYEWSGEDNLSIHNTFIWTSTDISDVSECGQVYSLYGAI